MRSSCRPAKVAAARIHRVGVVLRGWSSNLVGMEGVRGAGQAASVVAAGRGAEALRHSLGSGVEATRGSRPGCAQALHPGLVVDRTAGEAGRQGTCDGTEAARNSPSGALEDATVMGAEAAVVVDCAAIRNVGVVVELDAAVAPRGRPGTHAPIKWRERTHIDGRFKGNDGRQVDARGGRKLDETYKLAWLRGLKTTYYLRTMGATSAEKSTSRTGALNAVSNTGGAAGGLAVAEEAKFCSIDNPECEACQ